MRNYLSACAIFKNEADNLEEWLRFYDLIGVEHFYLYDNCSTDAFAPIVEPWVAAGKVTLFGTAPGKVQTSCYRHCFQSFRYDNVWIAFLDLDEFLFSPRKPDLRIFLKDYEKEAGVVANWVMFGASGHEDKPPGLTTLNFARRCPVELCTYDPLLLKEPDLDPTEAGNYHPICSHIKSIVNTRDVLNSTWSSHFFTYRDQRAPVTAWGLPVAGAFSDEVAIDALRINHYFSRSWSELRRKIERGRADSTCTYDLDQMIERNKLFDQIPDTTIFPLATQVQARMGRAVTG